MNSWSNDDFLSGCVLMAIMALMWGGLVRLVASSFHLSVTATQLYAATALVAAALILIFAVLRRRF